MDSHDVENYFASHKSILAVLLIIVGIASVSGYFMGMRQSAHGDGTGSPWLAAKAHPEEEKGVYPEAPRYKDIPGTDWKANRSWKNELANLPREPIDRTRRAAMEKDSLARTLVARMNRRAYDGAPPVIPHAINYRDVESCTACHSQDSNILVAGQRVPAMSHPYLTNCTQCHVPGSGLGFAQRSGTVGLVVKNKFHGKKTPGKGSRAYPGAPPTMPHRVWMRQNCMSCHGPGMPNAIVTSHPQRQNCLQCHAQDHRYDNREKPGSLTPAGEK